MTDLEITRLCAEAMGLEFKVARELWCDDAPLAIWTKDGEYRPLHDDAQAMALVKKFGIGIDQGKPGADLSAAALFSDGQMFTAVNEDLNRAICECVAKLQITKEPL